MVEKCKGGDEEVSKQEQIFFSEALNCFQVTEEGEVQTRTLGLCVFPSKDQINVWLSTELVTFMAVG